MIAFSRNLRKVIPVLGVVVMAVLIWRTILHFTCASSPYSFVCGIYDTDRIFHGTDSIIDCIAYGALAALVLHYHTRAVRRTLTGGPMLIAAATCLLASLLIRNSLFRDTVRFSLQSASVSILILNILFDRSGLQLKRALSWPLSILVGRLSYSLYLFHFGVLMLILALRQSTNLSFLPSVMAAYFIGSFACAGASYWLIEKPMVRVRRRIGAHTAS
ncbi:MAG: acyltransferase, partial [Acetobacteraceae bacterium]|nr:acyltransferase [Acetobacteraceae bacterium]